MKKWLSFILVFVLAFALVGCGEEPTPGPGPDDPTPGEEVKPTKIELSGIKEEIEVGEDFTFTVKVTPDNATNKTVRYATSSSAIATVKDGKVTGISAGEATITVTSAADKTVKAEFKVKVNGSSEEDPPVETVAPTALTITGPDPAEVKVNKVISLTVGYEPENATKGVTWTTSDATIAMVTNGSVVGKGEGTAVITATSTVDPNVKAEFTVLVTPAEQEIVIVIDPTSIVVEVSDEEVEVGYKLTARATVEPTGADQNVIWESTKPEVATIDANGKITGVAEGTTYIIAYTPDKAIKSSRVKVKVTAPTGPTPYPDLKGYKIVMMNADSALSDLDPFLDGYGGSDKMFKQQAWNEIQTTYNCTISVEAYPDEAPWGASRYQWINTQAELGDAKADFYVISSGWLNKMASVGSAHDAKSYYAKYGKNQMSLGQKQSATFRGGLYALSTGPNEATNYADYGLYYNLSWVEKLKVESPAKIFNEGNWTYSKFVEWCEQVQALLGEGQYALAGSLYYHWLGMSNAAGIKVADTTSVKVTLDSPRQFKAAEVLKTLYAEGVLSGENSWSESSGLFYEGKAVMTSGVWWFVKADNRWTTDLWGEDTRYGYVSFPRPDDMSKDQQRVAEYGTSLLMFAAGRDQVHPAGVTYEDVYQAMTDLYLRTSKYYTGDPSYDPETIKRTAIASKIDDPESVDAAMWWNNSNVFYDAVHDFFDSVSGCTLAGGSGVKTAITGTADYQAFVDSMQSTYVLTFTQTFSS